MFSFPGNHDPSETRYLLRLAEELGIVHGILVLKTFRMQELQGSWMLLPRFQLKVGMARSVGRVGLSKGSF
jgi:hypothetical protein